VIETRGLRRVFKSRKRVVEAVAGVDLTVLKGEIFGFLGPNGAGKTTTLRMLATLLPPSGGMATVAGYDLLTQPDRIRDRIGYVGQAGGADPEITGRRELVFQGTAVDHRDRYRRSLVRASCCLAVGSKAVPLRVP
jgi:ABC-2 type transport system ATP-binding protein